VWLAKQLAAAVSDVLVLLLLLLCCAHHVQSDASVNQGNSAADVLPTAAAVAAIHP
jgi:fumarate hydratase class II